MAVDLLDCLFRRNGDVFFIAGPCLLESEELALEVAKAVKKAAQELNAVVVFKGSFDKANRTSLSSARGPGLEEGLGILRSVKKQTGLLTTTDIHTPDQAGPAGEAVDIIQIPAFLCRQTDLILEAARHARAVNIKKGQFLAPADMKYSLQKALSLTDKVLLTERGTFFGYGNLVNDMKAVTVMREMGVPVVFDATHSVQKPGAMHGASGGEPAFIETLARCAAAAGADGLFFETHPDPAKALSDGSNSVALDKAPALMSGIHGLRKYISRNFSI